MDQIHQKALEIAARFRKAEADLISILQEVESSRVFLKLGFTSLFNYCVGALGLSESVTANFVTVARKAREVPVLQAAIQNGSLSVSKARKIAPVLTRANQAEWIERAQALSSRKLEAEVARVAPREAVPERMKPIAEDRIELRLGISKSTQEKLRRVQDLESQRTASAVRLEETLGALLDLYLEAKDPVKKADRVLKKMAQTQKNSNDDAPACVPGHVTGNRPHLPAQIRHEVTLRDDGRCTQLSKEGIRCDNRRWLDIHHVKPKSLGGTDTVANLVTLCSAHHKMKHQHL